MCYHVSGGGYKKKMDMGPRRNRGLGGIGDNKKLNCTYYDIDCGAVFSKLGYEDGRMACLRLDDEKEFYL